MITALMKFLIIIIVILFFIYVYKNIEMNSMHKLLGAIFWFVIMATLYGLIVSII
jgi:hypothetical protein